MRRGHMQPCNVIGLWLRLPVLFLNYNSITIKLNIKGAFSTDTLFLFLTSFGIFVMRRCIRIV